jgi:hypothetical protein
MRHGPPFEDELDDVRAILAVGSERAALFSCHTGGRLALPMAATHPDQWQLYAVELADR